MRVWVLEVRHYECYHYVFKGLFSSKEKAERWIRNYERQHGGVLVDYDISEHELDGIENDYY